MSDTVDYDGPAEPWQPPDGWDVMERLDWHARRARSVQAQIDGINDLFGREMDRLEARRDEEVAILQRKIDWHQAPIESYHRAHPDNRTIKLPHATSRLTVPKSPRIFAADLDAVIEWARANHPEILRSPNITDVRKVVQIADGKVIDPSTGEVVHGLAAEMPDPSWSLNLEPGEPF